MPDVTISPLSPVVDEKALNIPPSNGSVPCWVTSRMVCWEHFMLFEKICTSLSAEFEYRFNRRFNLPSIIERLFIVALRTPPIPYRFLRMAKVYG